LEKLTKFLGTKKFLTGENPKYADFVAYETVTVLNNIFSESFKEWTTLS
jgi:glutathionyl-hydroquinone reductase